MIRHTDWYNNQVCGGSTKFWYLSQFGLDVVNLGSWAGLHAFNYDGTPVKAANWALGPQSLVHDFNILKNYFSYIHEGGIVIITVSPFSGLVSNYDKTHNFKYYSFLHPATIQNFDEGERQKALRYRQNPFIEKPVYCIRQTVKEISRKAIARIKPPKAVCLEQSAKQIMDGWKKQFGINELSMPLSSQHEAEIFSRRKTLVEMITFCKERSLKPYIIVPVMHESLLSLFPDSFKSNYMDSLMAEGDAPVLDYMNDEMGKHDKYFSSALFLNQRGAKFFTHRVLKDLNLLP